MKKDDFTIRPATVSDVPVILELIRALAHTPGLERLRYTTSHPRDVDDALVAAHREVPRLMPYACRTELIVSPCAMARSRSSMNSSERYVQPLSLVTRLRTVYRVLTRVIAVDWS